MPPHAARTNARALTGAVHLEMAFPVRGSHGDEWSWSASMSPADARALAAQLLVAADTAATQLVPVREQLAPEPEPSE
jgi:hypothetical protein